MITRVRDDSKKLAAGKWNLKKVEIKYDPFQNAKLVLWFNPIIMHFISFFEDGIKPRERSSRKMQISKQIYSTRSVGESADFFIMPTRLG